MNDPARFYFWLGAEAERLCPFWSAYLGSLTRYRAAYAAMAR